eukprot:GHVU01063926.1.p3 GENE.GHVU01063926.1~~GHVU01063926.1.p3  ORF type:complete len:113 (-),score=5.61 GHVU01063926.1:223-561(-)
MQTSAHACSYHYVCAYALVKSHGNASPVPPTVVVAPATGGMGCGRGRPFVEPASAARIRSPSQLPAPSSPPRPPRRRPAAEVVASGAWSLDLRFRPRFPVEAAAVVDDEAHS